MQEMGREVRRPPRLAAAPTADTAQPHLAESRAGTNALSMSPIGSVEIEWPRSLGRVTT